MRIFSLLFACSLVTGGCATSFAPLYRDYQVTHFSSLPALQDSLQLALNEAGWTLTTAPTPEALRTHPQTKADLGLYRIKVFLDAVPLEAPYVRIFFHPYRYFIVGGRSKIAILRGDLLNDLIHPLDKALQHRGFVAVGTAHTRDKIPIR